MATSSTSETSSKGKAYSLNSSEAIWSHRPGSVLRRWRCKSAVAITTISAMRRRRRQIGSGDPGLPVEEEPDIAGAVTGEHDGEDDQDGDGADVDEHLRGRHQLGVQQDEDAGHAQEAAHHRQGAVDQVLEQTTPTARGQDHQRTRGRLLGIRRIGVPQKISIPSSAGSCRLRVPAPAGGSCRSLVLVRRQLERRRRRQGFGGADLDAVGAEYTAGCVQMPVGQLAFLRGTGRRWGRYWRSGRRRRSRSRSASASKAGVAMVSAPRLTNS